MKGNACEWLDMRLMALLVSCRQASLLVYCRQASLLVSCRQASLFMLMSLLMSCRGVMPINMNSNMNRDTSASLLCSFDFSLMSCRGVLQTEVSVDVDVLQTDICVDVLQTDVSVDVLHVTAHTLI